VVRILPQRSGQLAGVDPRQLGGAPRTALIEASAQPFRDREVAGAAGGLAQGRKPAGAEVDRVEGQPVGAAGLALGHRQELVRLGLGAVPRQCRRVPGDHVVLHLDVAGSLGDPGTGVTDLADQVAHERGA
jgi:hypothetical protein